MSLSGIVFQRPANLLWLFAAPVFVLLFIGMQHYIRLKLNKFGERVLIKRITPENSGRKQYIKFFILLTAYLLIITDLAKPEFSFRYKTKQAADLIILLDVSQSMMATDLVPNRLQAAKSLLNSLITGLENTRLALIPFAGQSIVMIPLTADKKTLLDFVDEMAPETIPVQGTLIAPGLSMAGSSFTTARDHTKIILLLTDGEDHEPAALEESRHLKQQGIALIICGIGTTQGSRIPVYKNGKFEQYKTDRQQNIIISKMNGHFLDSLATVSSGRLFKVENNSLINNNEQLISYVHAEIEKRRSKTAEKLQEINFPVYLLSALLLLLAEFVLSEKKNSSLIALYTRVKSKLWVLALLALLLSPEFAYCQFSYITARNGNKAYNQRDYQLAEKLFREYKGSDKLPALRFNLASALYQQAEYSQAEQIFTSLIATGKQPDAAWYDLANCLLMQKKYESSILIYIRYLHLKPTDHQALYNLAYARYMLRKQSMPPQNSAAQPPPPAMTRQNKIPQRSKIDHAAIKNALEKSQAKTSADKQNLDKDW